MTFHIKNLNVNFPSLRAFQAKAINVAKSRVALFPLGPSEERLNKFFLENNNVTLKHVCMYLINNTEVMSDTAYNLFVKFKSPKDDLLARFITYGGDGFGGSKILQCAFQWE